MCPDTLRGETVHRYLIVNADVVVAQDIVEIVQEVDPGAVVLVAAQEDIALALLAGLAGSVTAIVDADPEAFGDTALALELNAACHRVILTGADRTSAPGSAFRSLAKPFTAEELKDALRWSV